MLYIFPVCCIDLVSSPLLDSGHLELGDGVVARVEPLVQLLQDPQGGEDRDVPAVNQLGAAVGGGHDLPLLDDGATEGAGPVSALPSHHRGGAVRPDTPEGGAEGAALPGVLAPRAAALEVLGGQQMFLSDGRGPAGLGVAAQYLASRVYWPRGHHYQAAVTLSGDLIIQESSLAYHDSYLEIMSRVWKTTGIDQRRH